MAEHNVANLARWREHVQSVHDLNAEHDAHHAATAATALADTGRPDAISSAGDTTWAPSHD